MLDGPVGAWVPEASRFNGELWLAPAAHEADFRTADPAAVAPALRRALHGGQVGDPRSAAQLLAAHGARGPARLVPLAPGVRAAHGDLAGFELGTDIALVTKDPEAAAAEYRAALPPG